MATSEAIFSSESDQDNLLPSKKASKEGLLDVDTVLHILDDSSSSDAASSDRVARSSPLPLSPPEIVQHSGDQPAYSIRTVDDVHNLIFDPAFDESTMLSTEEDLSSSESDSDFDLSDAEFGIETLCISDNDLNGSSSSEIEPMEIPVHYPTNDSDSLSLSGVSDQLLSLSDNSDSPVLSPELNTSVTSTPLPSVTSTPANAEKQYGRGRGRTRGRGRGRGRGRCQANTVIAGSNVLNVMELSSSDNGIPAPFLFQPLRPTGIHLPDNTDPRSPVELFKMFFDDVIVDYICKASNQYAESLKDERPTMYKYYKSMTSTDLFHLIGICIHLGYRKIPRYRFAWSPGSLCYDKLVSKVMSRNRFEGLMAFLHLVDLDLEDQLKASDKLVKVRPVYEHINMKCRLYYQPFTQLSIDERMVRSKARFSYKQYIRNKPVKWGFKLWCLCDARTGYTIQFSVYRGKTGEIQSRKGLAYDVVMSLLQDYLDQGYSLYVDNFYTSPTLGSDLFSHQTHLTGTLNRKRIGVPNKVKDQFTQLSGSKITRGSGKYVRDGSLVYSIWRDTKCIVVMSNSHPGSSQRTVLRNWKDKDGKRVKADVPIPESVYQYNQYMGGVDLSDQLIKYYSTLRQTKKYWKTLWYHFIDIAVVNSYLIYKELTSNPMSHYAFREKLVRSLTGIPDQATLSTSLIEETSRPTTPSSCRISIDHRMVKMKSIRICVYCQIERKETHRTTRECFRCGIPLCFEKRNCFEEWHHRTFKTKRDQYLAAPPIKQGRGRPKVTKGRGKRKSKNW